MKKIKFIIALFPLLAAGVYITGCDDRMGDAKLRIVKAEGLQLNEHNGGLSLAVGNTASIAGIVTVIPIETTNKMEEFLSSDTSVATVDESGLLTAKKVGTSDIEITVDGQKVGFTLTVVSRMKYEVTEIEVRTPTVITDFGKTLSAFSAIALTPAVATYSDVIFGSSKPAVATIDEQGNIVAGNSVGYTTITVTSEQRPSVSKTFNIAVTEVTELSRTGWTVSKMSHEPLPISQTNEEGNALNAAFDNNVATNFCMTKPSRSFGESPNNHNLDNYRGEIWFVVDMQSAQTVSYFRVHHRELANSIRLRYHAFREISGSNDGVDFTLIAGDVKIPNSEDINVYLSPDIDLPASASKFRYIKFMARDTFDPYENFCFRWDNGVGSNVGIAELYIGTRVMPADLPPEP